MTLKLRDTLRRRRDTRCRPASITNCSSVDGTYTNHADVTVEPEVRRLHRRARTPGADGSKSFNPTSLVQKSGGTTKLTLNGTNASNIAATQLVIIDPTNGSNPVQLLQPHVVRRGRRCRPA